MAIACDNVYSTGIYIGAPRITYPFAYLGDRATTFYDWDFKVSASTYYPAALGVETDPADPSRILIMETPPKPTGIGDLIVVTRTFSTIPPDQSDPSQSIMVNRPTISANKTYDTYKNHALVRAGGGLLYSSTHLCDYSSQTAYDVFGPIIAASTSGFSTGNPPTGGTFVFAYKTSSTSPLAWNASAATIQTAINGLASMIADGLTVTAAGDFSTGNMQLNLSVSGGWDTVPPTFTGASLSPALARWVDINRISSTAWQFTTRYVLYSPTPHGLTNVGQSLIVRNNVLSIVTSANWNVYDANNLLFNGYMVANQGTVDALAGFLRAYQPGSCPVPCTVLTKFSLSPIAPSAYQGEGDAFLQAVFSGSTAINYRVGDAARWPTATSPIKSLATTIVSAANL